MNKLVKQIQFWKTIAPILLNCIQSIILTIKEAKRLYDENKTGIMQYDTIQDNWQSIDEIIEKENKE
jgi:hypothetical protein